MFLQDQSNANNLDREMSHNLFKYVYYTQEVYDVKINFKPRMLVCFGSMG